MSYTEIYRVSKSGRVTFETEFHNSHRGAMYAWMTLEKKYLPPYRPSWWREGMPDHMTRFSGDLETMQPVWDLVSNPEVSYNDRMVMASTFDRAYVRKDNLKKLVKIFEEFGAEHPNSSYWEQAQYIEAMARRRNHFGICWNQTSVNGDMYETDNGTKYNIFQQPKPHYDIFDAWETIQIKPS